MTWARLRGLTPCSPDFGCIQSGGLREAGHPTNLGDRASLGASGLARPAMNSFPPLRTSQSSPLTIVSPQLTMALPPSSPLGSPKDTVYSLGT